MVINLREIYTEFSQSLQISVIIRPGELLKELSKAKIHTGLAVSAS